MMPCFAQCKKIQFTTEISGTRLYFIINYKPKFGIFEQKESTWYIDLTSDFLFLHTFLLAVDKYLLTLKATSYFFIRFYLLLISISQAICCLLFVGCFRKLCKSWNYLSSRCCCSIKEDDVRIVDKLCMHPSSWTLVRMVIADVYRNNTNTVIGVIGVFIWV